MPIPFVAAGGPVNVYVIEADGGGLILFDAGLGSPPAEAALQAGFDRLGFRFEEVRRIVVSHGHVDHYGAARWVQERHGGALPVFAHPRDLMKIDERGPRLRDQQALYGRHFMRLGVPLEVLKALAATGEGSQRLARRVPDVQPIQAGAVVEGRGLRFEVIEMPGHTPGLICLWSPETGVLIPADHLLEKVSPNPIIELDAEGRPVHRPLAVYLESLERTRALEVSLVMPGHGPGFAGHRALIDGLLAFYEKRQARLVGPARGAAAQRLGALPGPLPAGQRHRRLPHHERDGRQPRGARGPRGGGAGRGGRRLAVPAGGLNRAGGRQARCPACPRRDRSPRSGRG